MSFLFTQVEKRWE